MTPQPQEVWADNDKRSNGRTLRVDEVTGNYALCSVLTVAGGRSAETKGKFPKIRILLARFTGNSTGYTLVETETPRPDDATVARHG
jgi:hypothetical protein